MLCVLLVGTWELLNVLGSHTTCRDDSEGASSANVADSRMKESRERLGPLIPACERQVCLADISVRVL